MLSKATLEEIHAFLLFGNCFTCSLRLAVICSSCSTNYALLFLYFGGLNSCCIWISLVCLVEGIETVRSIYITSLYMCSGGKSSQLHNTQFVMSLVEGV